MLASLPHLFRYGRAALLLVVVACLTPDRAQARCGHQSAIFKAPIVAAEPDATPAPAPAEAPTPCPCDGSNCSNRQDRDAPPPASSPTAPRASEAALTTDTLAVPPSRAAFARDRSAPRPIDQSSAIFHPPRSV